MEKCVYVFKIIGSDFYKIGFTNTNIERRLSALNSYNPNGAEIYCIINSAEPNKLENKLHKKFNQSRVGGEFFKLTDNDLKILDGYVGREYVDFINECHLIYQHGKISISEIRGLLLKSREADERIKKGYIDYSFFIPCIKEAFNGQYVTSSEIYMKMFDHFSTEEMEKVSRREFGKMLLANFERKTRKINGTTKRTYTVL